MINSKQPSYRLIYSLKLIELKTLQTYIITNLANGFIKPFKSLTDAPILFISKLNGSLQLYLNYQRLNNLIIKNKYLLSLIDEFLDWLG